MQPVMSSRERAEQCARMIAEHKAFYAAWHESNVPPAEITLDWLSLRFDIYSRQDESAGEDLFKFVQKYAAFDPAVFTLRSSPAYRELDFNDQAKMLSAEGYFENTPENAVILFQHIFADTSFKISKLEEVPSSLSAGVVQQYYERPRTYREYAVLVWRQHMKATAAVEKRKAEKTQEKHASLVARHTGLKVADTPP